MTWSSTRACDRVIVMAEGEIVTDGPAVAVLTASPTFAPQVAKILPRCPISPWPRWPRACRVTAR